MRWLVSPILSLLQPSSRNPCGLPFSSSNVSEPHAIAKGSRYCLENLRPNTFRSGRTDRTSGSKQVQISPHQQATLTANLASRKPMRRTTLSIFLPSRKRRTWTVYSVGWCKSQRLIAPSRSRETTFRPGSVTVSAPAWTGALVIGFSKEPRV